MPGASPNRRTNQPSHQPTSQHKNAIHHEGVHAQDRLSGINFARPKVEKTAVDSEQRRRYGRKKT
jgi:hypothetical protein